MKTCPKSKIYYIVKKKDEKKPIINQKNDFNERYIVSDLLNPDFMKLADSFGLLGLRVDTPEGLQTAMEKAFAEDGPALIEVEVGAMPSLWARMPIIRPKDEEN